jgi:hypothetical protein
MNDKLERMCNEIAVPGLKYYPNFLPEKLRKTTDNCTVDSRCPERSEPDTSRIEITYTIPPKPPFSVNPDHIVHVHYRVNGLLAIARQTRRMKLEGDRML